MTVRLRTRLVLGLVVPFVLTAAVSIVLVAATIGRTFSDLAQHHLDLDGNSADKMYASALHGVRDSVRLAAFDTRVADALATRAPRNAAARLERLRRDARLDVLDLLDLSGRVLLRARAPDSAGDSLAGRSVVAAVARGEAAAEGTAVVSAAELAREGADLADRARIAIVRTHVGAGDAAQETRGLLLNAAALVRDDDGRPVGSLYGAILLNRDSRLVDDIHRTIFADEKWKGRLVGEATICLDDLRVATSAALPGGERAVGTRIDPAVRQRVLVEGQPWVARAFVLDDWHIATYQPLRDREGRVIGALALGIPARKFTDLRGSALKVFLIVSLAGVGVSLTLAVLLTGKVEKPLRRLASAVRHVEEGDLGHRVHVDTSVAEIEHLAEHINRMAAALEQRDEVVRRQTEERVSRSERLAIVGRLAAGVAHQINNPLCGIMLFSNLLLRKAPAEGAERDNLTRIASETRRCQKIVQGLLDFARHREPKLEETAIATVIDKTLALVESQSMFLNVDVVRQFDGDAPSVRVDISQIQELVLNLVLNAVDAMNKRGRLTLSTATEADGRAVKVGIADTGCGIPHDALERVFEPFFTTKEEGEGTGLGLSICRGIVESHGGTIWVESEPGSGTTFFFRLPSAAEWSGKDAPAGAPAAL